MQASKAFEANFDGLVGPTHNYHALSWGNTASTTNLGEPSRPKAAALEGLEKMKRLHDLGVCQAVRVTLATADRPPPYFRCARVRCRPDGDELWLGEEAFDELMLRHHERVAVLGAQQSGEAAR